MKLKSAILAVMDRDTLKAVPVPVFILPGNHDPLNAASVYRSSTFIERRPEYVQVIETQGNIVSAALAKLKTLLVEPD